MPSQAKIASDCLDGQEPCRIGAAVSRFSVESDFLEVFGVRAKLECEVTIPRRPGTVGNLGGAFLLRLRPLTLCVELVLNLQRMPPPTQEYGFT